jgi:Tfp pilus assembly protein PilX
MNKAIDPEAARAAGAPRRFAAQRPRVPARAAERGSAYLFALMVLLVLTIVGLSLAVVTQSEVQIGGAEKTAVRVLYSSDAALRVQLASLFFNDPQERTLQFNPTVSFTGVDLQDRVQASAFFPIYSGPCNLCAVNTGNERFWNINHAVSAQTLRISSSGGSDLSTYADKTLGQMFLVQPMRERSIEALRGVSSLDTIRY